MLDCTNSRNPNIEKTVNGHFIGLSVSHDFYFVNPKKRDSYHIYVIFMLTLIFQLVNQYSLLGTSTIRHVQATILINIKNHFFNAAIKFNP